MELNTRKKRGHLPFILLVFRILKFSRIIIAVPDSTFYTLKVHKHEIFFQIFLQKLKPYGPKGL